MKSLHFRKKSLIAFSFVSVLIGMSACQLTENTLKADRSTHQEVQDYRDMLGPREAPLDKTSDSSIPDLKPYVADNSASLKPMPLVSISINQSIPLRDALFELAKQADYDVQLDPRIKGSIIYTARNKPFDTVISQISELAGLRFKFSDNDLKVELDTPYTKTYKVDYLSMTRESKSSIDTSTKIESSSDTNAKGGNETGSSFSVGSESKTDFWGELDTNIKQILAANSQLNYQITAQDPELSLSSDSKNAMPPVPPIDERSLNGPATQEPQAGEEKRSSLESNYSAGQSIPESAVSLNTSAPLARADNPTGSSVPPTTSPPDDQSGANGVAGSSIVPVQGTGATTAGPQRVQLNVSSLPSVTTADGSTTYTPSYSINKQAGLISVYATQKAHDQIGAYIDLMSKRVASQVLIEAKVLEVELNDEFTYGINWDVFTNDDTLGASLNIARSALTPAEPSTFVIQNGHNGLENLIDAIQRFGTIHALASPRVTVLNNQSAVLNVADTTVYFEIKSTVTDSVNGSAPKTDITSTPHSVPEGILVNVTPSIDPDRSEVSLQVRPTISRITGFVVDPGSAAILAQSGITDATLQNRVPQVSTREIDTVLKMQSGQTMVLGGLLQDRATGTQRAVPILGEVPIIGAAFRGQDDRIHKSEIVILIKATITKSGADTIHNTDRDLYRVYSQDRRPFKL